MSVQIYVGNLPYSINEDTLKTAFEAYGTVETSKIITDQYTGRSKGFGFVEMASQEEADKAIENLNDSLMDERKIKVSIAKPRENRERKGNFQSRRY